MWAGLGWDSSHLFSSASPGAASKLGLESPEASCTHMASPGWEDPDSQGPSAPQPSLSLCGLSTWSAQHVASGEADVPLLVQSSQGLCPRVK